jgi:putative component of membrane protein insertase Oxa1/YidC/SpoIIIJ protein YidD
MRRLILLSIELYWRLIDPACRKSCLFRETCSRHVYRMTREAGTLKGMMAFARRFRQCRPGYSIEFDSEFTPVLRLADHTVAKTADLSESMLAFVEQSRTAVGTAAAHV